MNTKKSLYIYSNSSDLSLFFASSIIAPAGASKGLKKAAYFELDHSVQLFNSVNSDYASYFEKNREENLVPVVLEINPAVLNCFYSIDEKKSLIKANSLEFYLLPFVPIYFVKNIHFASRDDLEHFNQIKFGNVNNSIIDNKIVTPNFFDGSHKKCKLIKI